MEFMQFYIASFHIQLIVFKLAVFLQNYAHLCFKVQFLLNLPYGIFNGIIGPAHANFPLTLILSLFESIGLLRKGRLE